MWTFLFDLSVIPSVISIMASIFILVNLNLPNNHFRTVVALLIFTDLILSALAIPLALENAGTIDFAAYSNVAYYAVCRFFFDVSFCISLSISLIAYYIVNMSGSMFMLSPLLLASLIFIPAALHVAFDYSMDQANLHVVNVVFFKNVINASLQSFVFTLWSLSFIFTYSELRSSRLARITKCVEAGLKRDQARHYASSLMMNLIIALIGVNLVMWLPVIIIDWLHLDIDIRTAHTSTLNAAFIFSVSSKGLFHALAILYVLGRKDKKIACVMEMKGFCSADTKTMNYCQFGNIKLPKAAKVRGRRQSGLLYCPSPDSSAPTVLDYIKV